MALTLPYPSLDFVPLDVLTAEEMNEIVANYTYIANQFPIGTANIASSAVTADKIDWTTTQHFSSYISGVEQVALSAGQGVVKRFAEFFGGTTAFAQMMDGKAIAAASVFVSGAGSTGDIRTKLMVNSSQFDDWDAYGFGINNIGNETRTPGCKVFLLLVDV